MQCRQHSKALGTGSLSSRDEYVDYLATTNGLLGGRIANYKAVTMVSNNGCMGFDLEKPVSQLP